MIKKERRYNIFTTLMIIKDYLNLIDMAKDKTVLQTLGFAYGDGPVIDYEQTLFCLKICGEERKRTEVSREGSTVGRRAKRETALGSAFSSCRKVHNASSETKECKIKKLSHSYCMYLDSFDFINLPLHFGSPGYRGNMATLRSQCLSSSCPRLSSFRMGWWVRVCVCVGGGGGCERP